MAVGNKKSAPQEQAGADTLPVAPEPEDTAPEPVIPGTQPEDFEDTPPTAAELRAMLPPSGFDQFFMGINDAIASVLDIAPETVRRGMESRARHSPGVVPDPLDLLRELGVELPPFPVRQFFADKGVGSKPGQEPDTAAYSAGHMAGMSLPFLMAAPFGAGVQTAGLAPGLTAASMRAVKEIGETTVRRPVTSSILEMVSGIGAGTGASEARRLFPDSEAAEMIGALLGGLTPAGLTSAAVATRFLPGVSLARRGGGFVIRRVRELGTVSGAERRAVNRVDRALGDADAALGRLDDPGTLPEAQLTQAQRTRDPGLLALERSVLNSSDDLRIRSDQQIAELNATITSALEAPPGATEKVREAFEAAQAYLLNLLNGRLRIAALEADRRIAELAPGSDPKAANIIVREEIDKARAAARAQESELYAAIEAGDVVVIPEASKNTLVDVLLGRGRTADPADIPQYIRQFLGTVSKTGEFKPGMLDNGATFDELRVLRSRILRDIREEQAKDAPNRTKIAFLEDMQESLLADLGAMEGQVTSEVGQQLRVALDFSRNFNDRFSRGAVGRILGRRGTGEAAVSPELTLEATLGIRGAKAAQNARQILDAVKNAPDEVIAAAGDFIKDRFINAAVRNGAVDVTKAENFLRSNRFLLDEFPQVRTDIEAVIQSGKVRNLAENRASRVGARLAKPSISKATMFIQQDPAKAFQAIRESRRPATEMRNLLNMAARDKTGEATEGLQAVFVDWLLKLATISSRDAMDRPFVSGARLSDALDDPGIKAMMDVLLTPEQIKRIGQVRETALTLDAARTAKESTEGIIKDTPNALMENLARIGVLRAMSRIAPGGLGGGAGAGVSLQTANMVSNRTRDLLRSHVKDPASRLIIDAITSDDPELLKSLMMPMGTPQNVAAVNRRVNAWLAAVLFEVGLPSLDVQRQPQRGVPSAAGARREQANAPTAAELRQMMNDMESGKDQSEAQGDDLTGGVSLEQEGGTR